MSNEFLTPVPDEIYIDGRSAHSFNNANLTWPLVIENDAAVPKIVLKIYKEASYIKVKSPSAFVVHIRKALEAICNDQGITGKTKLYKKLQKLSSLGKLPSLLSEVTDVIKLIGNAGAHHGPDVHNYHAGIVDDFFRLVLQYLYIAPAKLNKFKSEIEKF